MKGINPKIEFVDIGGNPKKMMEFIVKHPSMITLNFNEVGLSIGLFGDKKCRVNCVMLRRFASSKI